MIFKSNKYEEKLRKMSYERAKQAMREVLEELVKRGDNKPQ